MGGGLGSGGHQSKPWDPDSSEPREIIAHRCSGHPWCARPRYTEKGLLLRPGGRLKRGGRPNSWNQVPGGHRHNLQPTRPHHIRLRDDLGLRVCSPSDEPKHPRRMLYAPACTTGRNHRSRIRTISLVPPIPQMAPGFRDHPRGVISSTHAQHQCAALSVLPPRNAPLGLARGGIHRRLQAKLW